MVFHLRLSDSKSPQVSRTLLSILTVFNNAVVWMVSTRPPTSKSSRPFNNPLVTVPKAPITIGIIVTFIFKMYFQFSSKVEVLLSLLLSFNFQLYFRFLTILHRFITQYRQKGKIVNVCLCLFGFYGKSTFVGYLMPNPFLDK